MITDTKWEDLGIDEDFIKILQKNDFKNPSRV